MPSQLRLNVCACIFAMPHVCGIANTYTNTFKRIWDTCEIENTYTHTFKRIWDGVRVKWSSVAGIKGDLLTRSWYWFRRGSAQSHASDKAGRRTEGKGDATDKNGCRDNKEGHSRLEHRTIATAGQCLVILVCSTAV